MAEKLVLENERRFSATAVDIEEVAKPECGKEKLSSQSKVFASLVPILNLYAIPKHLFHYLTVGTARRMCLPSAF